MAEESKKDLKEGEDSPSGADQPENESTGSNEENESTGATGTSGATGSSEASGASGSDDDQVSVSKSELEELRKKAGERDNLSKAVIRLNKKLGRKLPGSEPLKKKKKVDDEGDDEGDDDTLNEEKFVTKAEMKKRDDKRAINDACNNDEISLNWNDIMEFYVIPKDDSYESKLAAIKKAHKLWRADEGITDKPDEEKEKKKKAAKAKQDLATEKSLNKGKEKKPVKTKKRTIIKKSSSMNDWY